ncbi:hypothetical protein CDEST_04248 [Colletotrichum destructivum]|uniref:Uncharacterized protein n=1 Tax=Colletotrichum destructivum TaxID=34406 RepID=A0AAX4I775_9PEZI|nr:hypothetical protein CDEST_04248 [Colletotrichum destructivum]
MRFLHTVITLSALAVSIDALPFSVTKNEDGQVHDMSIHDTSIVARQAQPPPSALVPEPAAEADMDEFEDDDVEDVVDDGEVDAQGKKKKKKKKGKKGKKGKKKGKKPLDAQPDADAQPAPAGGAVPAAGAAPVPGAPAAAAPPPAGAAPAAPRSVARAFKA